MNQFAEVKAICFDLDDTLCGYWDASKIGLRAAFEQHGPPDKSADEMIAYWAAAFRKYSPLVKQPEWYAAYLQSGAPTRFEQMRKTLEVAGLPPDDEMAQKLSDSYHFERDHALKLFPDAIPVLDVLDLRGYPMGLITNGPADNQLQEIETLKIGHYFKVVLIEGVMGYGKPEERVFRRAEKEFGVGPSEMLFVGNSYGHDIRPALEFGWKAIWIRRPSDIPPSHMANGQAKPEERPEGSPAPHAVVGSLTEVLELLTT